MLYAVSPLAQKAEVDRFCFKECGQIIVGGIEIEGAPFCPCRTQNCLFEEKTLDLGEAMVFGKWERIIVRKLKSCPGNRQSGGLNGKGRTNG